MCSVVRNQHLVHQTNKIPKSICQLPRDLNKIAINLHTNLLGYMGDKQMPFEATLAQDLMRKGFDHKDLRDEIYSQIIKQLTNNRWVIDNPIYTCIYVPMYSKYHAL